MMLQICQFWVFFCITFHPSIIFAANTIEFACPKEKSTQLTGLRVETNDAVVGYEGTGVIKVMPSMEMTVRFFGCDMYNVGQILFTEDATQCSRSENSVVVTNFAAQLPDTLAFKVTFPADGSRYFVCISNEKVIRSGSSGSPAPSTLQDSGNTSGSGNGPTPKTGVAGFIHQGREPITALLLDVPDREYYMPMPLQITVLGCLLMLSGLFSGLNLGLMALDTNELKLIMKSGKPKEKRCAETIYPVRKTGNFLLCSLLLGNVIVNSAISILFDDLTSGIVALAVSSMGIVIFGEIVPQSVCSRYGLAVGAKTIYITRFFMMLTSPMSWPISKLLDCILGEEVGTVYDKERLLEMIKMSQETQKEAKDWQEVQIVSGALELSKKVVKDIMTHIRDVYMLPHDAVLDPKHVGEIVQSGYTRIPVYEGTRAQFTIVGILNVKDLALLDPDDKIPVKTVCQFYRHPVRSVMGDMPLINMLDEFKKGHYHMAFVEQITEEGGGDPVYDIIGLVTLEDILEEILQAEIVDETDVITDNRRRIPRHEVQHKDFSLITSDSTPIGLIPGTKTPSPESYHISPQLMFTAYQHLTTNFEPFEAHLISEHVLQRLIKQSAVFQCGPDTTKTKREKLLYEKGKPADYFVLILEGHMEVIIGEENNVFDAGPFHSFGKQVLEKMAEIAPTLTISDSAAAIEGCRQCSFEPDFSAKIKHDLTYLLIRAGSYLKVGIDPDEVLEHEGEAYRATLIEKSKGTSPSQVQALLNSLGSKCPIREKEAFSPSRSAVSFDRSMQGRVSDRSSTSEMDSKHHRSEDQKRESLGKGILHSKTQKASPGRETSALSPTATASPTESRSHSTRPEDVKLDTEVSKKNAVHSTNSADHQDKSEMTSL